MVLSGKQLIALASPKDKFNALNQFPFSVSFKVVECMVSSFKPNDLNIALLRMEHM